MQKNIRHILMLIYCFCNSTLFAQETDIQLNLLQPQNLSDLRDSSASKVVSASRTSKNIDDLPITIYVITHEEILKNQYYTLGDVLKALPGISVSQPGTGEFGEVFQMRNLPGNMYTKILIDGIPIKPAGVRGMPIGEQLPVRQAERIEVVYGPAAAVYGADAAGGVINIVTKESTQGTFVRGDMMVGANDHKYMNFTIGGKAGKNKRILNYSFYGSMSESPDLNIVNGYENSYNPLNYYAALNDSIPINNQNYYPTAIDETLLNNLGYSTESFKRRNFGPNYEGTVTLPEFEEMPASSSLMGYKLKYKAFSFSYHYMNRKTHSSLGKSSRLYKFNDPLNYWGENIHRGAISYTKKRKKLTAISTLSTLTYRMDNSSSIGVTFLDYTDKTYMYSASDEILLDQLYVYTPNDKLEFVSGLSLKSSSVLPLTTFLNSPFYSKSYSPYITEDISYRDTILNYIGYKPILYNNASMFIQMYYEWEKFRIMGGFRFDANSLYKPKTNPRLAVLYKWNARTSIRASVGYAYKTPPVSQAYQNLAVLYGSQLDSIKYIATPNHNLEPERFSSMEVGLNRKIGKNVYLNISGFYNEIGDYIYTAVDTLNLAITYTNTSDRIIRIFGGQSTLRWDNINKRFNVDAELALSYVKQEDKRPDLLGLVKENLKLSPEHTGQLKISAQPTSKLYIHLENIWWSDWIRVLIPIDNVSDKLFSDLEGYSTINIAVNYDISLKLNLYLKINNLFDERFGGFNQSYFEDGMLFSPQMGRYSRFGLNYVFN